MRTSVSRSLVLLAGILMLSGPRVAAQSKGIAAIRADDMKFHVQFLGAPEFRGRNMPSAELEIASRYIALTAQRLGLRPVLPNGSFFQEMPIELSTVSTARSFIAVTSGSVQTRLATPSAFAVRGRWLAPARASGRVVFAGLGISAPALGWDDLAALDLKGAVVVLLDAPLPASHALRRPENRAVLARRASLAIEKGAAAVLTVIPPDRENDAATRGLSFDNAGRGRPTDSEIGLTATPVPAVLQVELRHEAAAAILGVSAGELEAMFDRITQGQQVPAREIPGRTVEVVIEMDSRPSVARNVVAMVEGRDPVLKNEYVVLGSHHDGIGAREGAVFPGADDNISGVVAMFSIARALMVERPRRSVIFVWQTGEEKGLLGAYYFVSHSPVPVERITANLNMDMLSRNDPGSVYVIGSNKLSSELDTVLKEAAGRVGALRLDYKYEDPGHPDRFFFRSDHYPYLRYGIPAVWLFCGTTDDYHQPADTEDRMDYVKMEKLTRFTYLAAMEIGNAPALLKLDLHPKVTRRGKHNLAVAWQ